MQTLLGIQKRVAQTSPGSLWKAENILLLTQKMHLYQQCKIFI